MFMTCPWKSINSNVWEAEAGESFEMKVYTWSKEHSSMAMRESLSKKKKTKSFLSLQLPMVHASEFVFIY